MQKLRAGSSMSKVQGTNRQLCSTPPHWQRCSWFPLPGPTQWGLRAEVALGHNLDRMMSPVEMC